MPGDPPAAGGQVDLQFWLYRLIRDYTTGKQETKKSIAKLRERVGQSESSGDGSS